MENAQAIQGLEIMTEKVMSDISGQIQGMAISMQAIVDFGTQEKGLMEVMEKQNVALAQCLKVCTTALSSAAKTSGHEYKYVRALDNALQLVGNVGNVNSGGASHVYSAVLGQDQSVQVLRDMDGSTALAFFREHRHNNNQ